MIYSYEADGQRHTVRVEREGESVRVTVDAGEARVVSDVRIAGGVVEFESAGGHRRLRVARSGQTRFVANGADVYELRAVERGAEQQRPRAAEAEAGGGLEAAMPGQVIAVSVQDGDAVTKGQTLVILEAMKMELRVQAPRDGRVAHVLVKTGDVVERGQKLVEIA